MPPDSLGQSVINGKFARDVSKFMGTTEARLDEGDARMDRMEQSVILLRKDFKDSSRDNSREVQSVKLTLARWGGALAALILLVRFGPAIAAMLKP